MKRVSVIIPTYNRRMYLGECVESVMSQTYKEFEIIIVDDNSTDNTYSFVQELIQKYGCRIRYLSNTSPKGSGPARNIGLQNAQGEYIAFLDSDDLWDKDNLKVKTGILDSNPSIDGILSDSAFFGKVEDGYMSAPYIKQLFQDRFWDKIDGTFSIARLSMVPFLLERGSPFRIQSLILRKGVLSRVGLFNESYWDDADYIIRCICIGKIGYVHNKLCSIRRHALNTDNIINSDMEAESDFNVVKTVEE